MGIQIAIGTVTPDMAVDWLANHNLKNRKLKPTAVKRYCDAMRRGEWKVTGQAIQFDEDGVLIDGQNRLQAVVRFGEPVEFLIVRGLPVDSRSAIDQGVRRNASDHLTMLGYTSTNALAAAIKIHLCYVSESFGSLQSFSPSLQEIESHLNEHPGLRDAIPVGYWTGIHLLMPTSEAGFLYYLFYGIAPEAADEFFEKLDSGANLGKGNPILILRTRLMGERASKKHKFHQRERLALCIKAWNYFRAGKTQITTLRWTTNSERSEPFPKAS